MPCHYISKTTCDICSLVLYADIVLFPFDTITDLSPTRSSMSRDMAPSSFLEAASATTAFSVGNPILSSCCSRREETEDFATSTFVSGSSDRSCKEANIPAFIICSSSNCCSLRAAPSIAHEGNGSGQGLWCPGEGSWVGLQAELSVPLVPGLDWDWDPDPGEVEVVQGV